MDRPLKIGIDIDDVLNNLFPHWIEEWNKVSGQNLNYLDCKEWDLHKFINNSDFPEFLKVIAKPEFYDTLKPDSLAQIILKELIDAGAEIYIITGTYTPQHVLKEEWLKKHYPYINLQNVLYVPRGAKHLVNVDIMIEDSPEDIEQFGCSVLLLNKTYNMDLQISARANIHRVNNWLEIRQIFVDKYDLLPAENKEINEYNESFGKQMFSDYEPLSEKLMKCKTVDDFAYLLNPYFDKMWNAGYSSALSDVANSIKDLFPKE